MSQRTVAQAEKKNATPLASGLLRHTAVRPIADHDTPTIERPGSFARDFSQTAVRTTMPSVGQNYGTPACPVFPRTCPFGGACRTCPPPVQAKLQISQPGNKYEREADRMAEQVMRMPEPQIQRQVAPEEERFIQAKELPGKSTEVAPDVEAHIQSLSGDGQPLSESVRAFFEPRLGYDFSQVRVHTNSRAAETAQAIKARAFTVGRNVVFGKGQYAPETSDGRRLLAHELSHAVQQREAEAGRLRGRILRQEDERAKESPATAVRAVGAAAGAAARAIGAAAGAAARAVGAAAGAAAAVMTPLTFNVATINLTPKRWADRGNVNAGAADTRTNITIGGPPNSTIDITHVRQDAPDYGHAHTNEPAGAMAQRFKHGHLTNRADGRGRQYNDFQISSRGNNRIITYHAPHAAGEVLLTAQIRGRADAAARRQVRVTTAVIGLQQYNATRPNEVLVGQTANHGTNHWGTNAAITRMHNIVTAFRNAWVAAAPEGTERDPDDAPTIRINDFSLRHGGVYDFTDNWRDPHKTHRFGEDIDISRSVLINGALTYLAPGNDAIGEIYGMLNAAIGVNPEDANHWHVDV